MCYSEGKLRASKILRETSFEFVLLGWRWQYKSCCSKTSVAICACLKTVYTVAKSVQEPSIMEKYPILQICRTAGFKIDLYIPMPETFCQLSGKGDFALLLLTSFEKLLGFCCMFSLQSLIVTNDFRIWTPRTRLISRTSWTPDCFVSRKVKLLKIIKTDSVINISRACTEIFPKADTKERDFLPIKDRYSSVRCVILKDKALCLKILRETSFEFVFLG